MLIIEKLTIKEIKMEFNLMVVAKTTILEWAPIFAKVCISTVLISALAFGFFYLAVENGGRK